MHTNLPIVKLDRGIHVMHLFYRIERVRWQGLSRTESDQAREQLQQLCDANAQLCQPRLLTYAVVGGKAELGFMLFAAELGQLCQIHRDLEAAFPLGTLQPVYNYLSVTETSEYSTTEEDNRQQLIEKEKLTADSPEFERRLTELTQRRLDYEKYRLYPELPDWEVMGFYPMSKRRVGAENWYSLDFPTRKQLMAGHARTGRKYAGRISQLITGSTGLDDWEWGVTLMAHQLDALKEIVYEMRFEEVSTRFGEFGPFYVNLRLQPSALWAHLRL